VAGEHWACLADFDVVNLPSNLSSKQFGTKSAKRAEKSAEFLRIIDTRWG
jgi:hypothetical protein